jgi:hypothetical protein
VDPENQRGNGGLSDEAAFMVKRRFSKPIRGSTTLFFFVSAEIKWKKQCHEGAAVAEQLDPPLHRNQKCKVYFNMDMIYPLEPVG